MKIYFRKYLWYKFTNSAFTGLVGGSIFTIYASLSPSFFSLGGIALALGLWVMALYYHRLMTLKDFFIISLLTETIMLFMVGYFLLFSEHQGTALVVYIAYQVTFMFGGYSVRIETMIAKKGRLLGWIDAKKQQGYIVGLIVSYTFYKILEIYGVNDPQRQVYDLHLLLFLLEGAIITLLIRAFGLKR